MTRTFGVLGLAGAVFSAGAALAAALLAAPSLARAQAACGVSNVRSHAHHDTLQAAVTAATAGDRLRVSGVCSGTTVVDRNLVIRGAHGGSGRPALDGGRAGRVLEISAGVTVRLAGLEIRHGKVRGGFGGGILNHGTLTLSEVVVLSNRADSGGGIYSTGELVLDGTTVVKHNRALVDDGGGVYADGGRLTVTDASTVHHNVAGRGGGGIYAVTAEVTLDGTTSVHHNEATTGGGGIYADFDSTVSLNGSTAVHDNVAGQHGGGIFDNSSVTMGDSSSVENNTSSLRGGGVFVGCFAELSGAEPGGNVRDNNRMNVARESGCS